MTDRLDQLFYLLKLERPKGVDPILALKLDIERLMDTERRWTEACALARVHCPVGDGESHIRQGIPRQAARIRELEQRLERVSSLLAHNGCDCPCDHHHEEHDDDCERCLACQIGAALTPPPEQAPPDKQDHYVCHECDEMVYSYHRCPRAEPDEGEQPATPPEQAPARCERCWGDGFDECQCGEP